MEIMQFIITSLPTLNQGSEETNRDSRFVFFVFIEMIFNGIGGCGMFREANLKLQLLLLKTVQKVC